MSGQQRVGTVDNLPPGKVTGVGRYAVGNAGGRYFAVTHALGCLACKPHGTASFPLQPPAGCVSSPPPIPTRRSAPRLTGRCAGQSADRQ